MVKSRNRKGSARTSLTALRRIEEAMAGLLGTDAYNERVRRYVAEHDAPADDRVAFERLCLTIFAQGLGFDAVERYRGALKSAFSDFVPESCGCYRSTGPRRVAA